MKPEDIFEIFTDIDEKMVAEAKKNFFEDNDGKAEEYTAEPVIVSAARKAFRGKRRLWHVSRLSARPESG